MIWLTINRRLESRRLLISWLGLTVINSNWSVISLTISRRLVNSWLGITVSRAVSWLTKSRPLAISWLGITVI